MTVPLPLLYAVLPVVVVGMIGFVTWLVQQITRHAQLLATASTELTGHGDRLKRLEGWQDGVQYGRAVEAANHKPAPEL